MRDNYPDGFLAVPKNKVARIHASTGTTGKPTVTYYTKKDMEVWTDITARVLCIMGVEEDDIVQISMNYGLFTAGIGFHYASEKIGCTVIPASTGNTQKQLLMLSDMGATILMGTPSYATYLSDVIRKSEYNLEDFKIRKLIVGAERCTKSMLETIKNNLGVDAMDTYGLSECFGPGVAAECDCKCGLHVSEDVFYPEIIDPATGEQLPEGEQGELVFTSLLREGMPLLRYRTKDITTLSYDKCECGRTTVRMQAPFARSDDMFVIKGVNVFPSEIECVIDKLDDLAPYYQIKLERNEQCIDNATVFIELKEPCAEYTADELEMIKKKFNKRMKEIALVRMDIVLLDPETLERYEGKATRVVDLRYKSE